MRISGPHAFGRAELRLGLGKGRCIQDRSPKFFGSERCHRIGPNVYLR